MFVKGSRALFLGLINFSPTLTFLVVFFGSFTLGSIKGRKIFHRLEPVSLLFHYVFKKYSQTEFSAKLAELNTV